MGTSEEKEQAREVTRTDFRVESFKYQLDCLKSEIELIDRAIARFDGITQTTKNWAIVTWTGSIAIALGQVDLRKYIIFTAVLPLLFWFVDAWWRHLQKRSVFRQTATRMRRALRYKEISLFYGGLAVISLAVGLLFLMIT